MIIHVPLRDDIAIRLRALAAAERRTPRQQAAYLIESALAGADRGDSVVPPRDKKATATR